MNESTAIVVIAYNRSDCLKRLLASLQKAQYQEAKVPLVISIDKSDSKEVEQVAEAFQWEYGEKRINREDQHLGLKEHVFRCGRLAKEFGSVILLEDDLLVSPFFYRYALEARNFYDNDDLIAG